MVRSTRRRRIQRKRTRKHRGGGPPGFLTGLGAAAAKRSQGVVRPPGAPSLPANGGPGGGANGSSANNDPLAKYRKMLKMGQPPGAIQQKMLTNGKNPSNIFPNYVPASVASASRPLVAPVKAPAFTLDDFRDLKDYVGRSEIVARMHKSGLNPTEIYPEITAPEITSIVEEYSKPREVKAPNAPHVNSGAPKLSMKNAIMAGIKGRAKINGVKKDISFFTEYTAQEQTDLNTLDSSKARIKSIETNDLVAAKKSIKMAEEKGQQIKDFQLKTILGLLKEKRDLEIVISRLDTDKLKNKVKFARGQKTIAGFSEDSNGPLPKGWKVVVNSEDGTLYYENIYLRTTTIERPTEPAQPPDIPEGWELNENDEHSWYLNTFTGEVQWDIPEQSATFGYESTTNSSGSTTWYKPVEGRNGWYEMRNASGMWYENPSNRGNGVRFAKPE